MNSDDWDKRYNEKKLIWSAGPNQFVVSEVKGMAPGRALDVACGEGRNALWLAEQGWDVTALDYSPVAIQKGEARSREVNAKIGWRVADATTDIEGTYDLILYLSWPCRLTRVDTVNGTGVASQLEGEATRGGGKQFATARRQVTGRFFSPMLADVAGCLDRSPASAVGCAAPQVASITLHAGLRCLHCDER